MTAAGVAILATLVLFSLWFTGALWLVARITDTDWMGGMSLVQISIAALVGIIGTWASWYLAIDSVDS